MVFFLEVYSATTFVSLYTSEMAYMGRADGRQYRSVCWRFSYGIFLGAYGEKIILLSINKIDSMPIKSSLTYLTVRSAPKKQARLFLCVYSPGLSSITFIYEYYIYHPSTA